MYSCTIHILHSYNIALIRRCRTLYQNIFFLLPKHPRNETYNQIWNLTRVSTCWDSIPSLITRWGKCWWSVRVRVHASREWSGVCSSGLDPIDQRGLVHEPYLCTEPSWLAQPISAALKPSKRERVAALEDYTFIAISSLVFANFIGLIRHCWPTVARCSENG